MMRRGCRCRRIAEAGSAPSTTPTASSLYDRLRGFIPIAAVLERFSDAVIVNPKLNQNPGVKAWNETQAQTRPPWLEVRGDPLDRGDCRWPFEYTGLPLDEAHADLHLTADEFAEVGAEIVLRPSTSQGVPEREKQELVDAYQTSMSDVVTIDR